MKLRDYAATDYSFLLRNPGGQIIRKRGECSECAHPVEIHTHADRGCSWSKCPCRREFK